MCLRLKVSRDKCRRLLRYYLGMEVYQTKECVTICQAAYAENIVSKAGMKGCNTTQVPMEAKLKLSKEGSGQPVDATLYRSIVGSLRYLVNTRLDLAFSVGYVSRLMEASTTEH